MATHGNVELSPNKYISVPGPDVNDLIFLDWEAMKEPYMDRDKKLKTM